MSAEASEGNTETEEVVRWSPAISCIYSLPLLNIWALWLGDCEPLYFQLGTKKINAVLMGRYVYREHSLDAVRGEGNHCRCCKIAQHLMDGRLDHTK